MYYGLILISVIMFGGCFYFNDEYRKRMGGSLKISLKYSAISSFAAAVMLLILNKFKVEFTLFTFLIALASSITALSFSFCAFKALGSINLSLYSLFSMLGGMAIPFVQGIVFYNESITVAKVICFILICIALLLTIEKGEKKKGTIYYIGIFTLNGMSGVLSKIFTSAPYEKTSAQGYTLLITLITLVLSVLILTLFFRKDGTTQKDTPVSLAIAAASGVTNKLANLWLVIALAHVDASVQYPMVTGGVMIVSTLICFFGEKKPSKKEIASVLVAFVGMLALFAIPV